MSDEGRRVADRETCVLASARLLDYVGDDLVPALRKIKPSPTCSLILAFLMRGLTTFEAMVELARHGYGEQIAMLNRSLFEQMIDAHWIARNGMEANG